MVVAVVVVLSTEHMVKMFLVECKPDKTG